MLDVRVLDHLPWLYLDKSKRLVAFPGLYSDLSEVLRRYLGLPKVLRYLEVPKGFPPILYLGLLEYIGDLEVPKAFSPLLCLRLPEYLRDLEVSMALLGLWLGLPKNSDVSPNPNSE